MKRFKRLLRARRSDERGAVLVFTALSMVLLLWAGAMGVDVGFTVFGSRTAQAMADTAALDLSRYLDIADAQVSQQAAQTYLDGKLSQVLADNGSNATLTAVPGKWANGKWTVPSACQSGTPYIPMVCNAVMVTATQKVPQIFYGGFNSLSARSAIAANTPSAGFSIGTFLANLNTQQSPALNAVLGSLGGSANLTLVGYQGLATSYVTLNQLISADSTVLSPTNILSASMTPSQWLSVLKTALGNQIVNVNCNNANAPGACEVYNSVLGQMLTFSGNQQIQLCQLLWLNQTNSPPTGSSCSNTAVNTQGLNASVNILQMLTTMAELANGQSGIDITSALNIAGITSAKLQLTVVQPPSVAYGPVGTVASTGQINATLNLQIAGLNLVSLTLNGATGTARLATINCTNNVMQQTNINASTTVASGALSILGTAGNLATINVAGVPSAGLVFAGSNVPPTPETLTDDYNPVQIGTTTPALTLSGWSVLSPFYLILNPILAPLSSALGPVLSALGLTVGGADVADLSTNCDAVSIVQ